MSLPTLISWTGRVENEMYTKIKLVCVHARIYLQQYATARCMFTQYMFTCGGQKIPSGHIPEVCFIFFFQLGSLVGLELAMKSRLDGSQDPGISYLSLPSRVLGWQGLTTTSGFLFACIFKISEASFTNYIYLKISYMYTIYLDHIKHSLLLSSSPWNLPKRLSLPTLCPILFITLWLRLSLLI